MAPSRTRRRPAPRRLLDTVGKPRGVLHPRVQQVGPEHFGIVCFDCAKAFFSSLMRDVRTLVPIAWGRVANGEPMPGVIVVCVCPGSEAGVPGDPQPLEGVAEESVLRIEEVALIGRANCKSLR